MVDANVILDVFTEDPAWASWSVSEIENCAAHGPLVINPVVYAEVSVRYSRKEELDLALAPGDYRRDPLPWQAAFLAGRCFVEYRRHGGMRRSPLPDFFIGAHAAVNDMRLLTRDARRYRTYFPTLRIIAPR